MARKLPKTSGIKFPRTLYKRDPDGTQDFTNAVLRHVMYDSVIVHNDKEMNAAEEMGYIDSFHDAIFGIEEPDPVGEIPDEEEES